MGHAFTGPPVIPRRKLLGRLHAFADADRRRPSPSRGNPARGKAACGSRKIAPLVDPRRFSFETVAEAYGEIENRTANGKIVIDVADQSSTFSPLKKRKMSCRSSM